MCSSGTVENASSKVFRGNYLLVACGLLVPRLTHLPETKRKEKEYRWQ